MLIRGPMQPDLLTKGLFINKNTIFFIKTLDKYGLAYTFVMLINLKSLTLKTKQNEQSRINRSNCKRSSKLTKADAGRALDSTIEAVSKALKKGDRISLVGFGSFSVAKRAARLGRNPQTGKEIKIAAKKVVKFKAGTELAGNVNKGK